MGTSRELVHSVEHRLFLDGRVAKLEDDVVRHNGMTHWSGIRLEFTTPPEDRAELEAAVRGLFEKELPAMTFEERERFSRELEEGGGDFLDAALDEFREELWKSNGLSHDGSDEEGLWASLDPESVRFCFV